MSDTHTRNNSDGEAIRREVDKAWLAGIIDGEGSLWAGWHKQFSSKTRTRDDKYLTISLQIVNTNREMIRKAEEVIRSCDVKPYVNYYRKANSTRPWGLLVLKGQGKMQKFLPQILPYLVAKKPQAETILAIISYRQTLHEHHGRYRTEDMPMLSEEPVLLEMLSRLKGFNQGSRHHPLNDYTPSIPDRDDDIVSSAR